jgi:cytochrome c5
MKSFCIGLLSIAGLIAANSTCAATAEETYKKNCSLCHDAGVAGAPKFGDKAAWAPRVKQGKDALYKVAMAGKPGTAMMPKGGNASLTDAEVKAVVDLMMAKAK